MGRTIKITPHSGFPVALVFCAIASSGCATIERVHARDSETIQHTSQESRPTGSVLAKIEQSGTQVSLSLVPACDGMKIAVGERTSHFARINTSKMSDWVAGIAGLGLAATGAVVIVDAKKVGSASDTSQDYNPLGKDGALVIGIGAVVVGAALLTIPTVDIIRSQGEETSKEPTKQETLVSREIPCPGATPQFKIAIRFSDSQEVSVGETDTAGHLSFDLAPTIPDNLLRSSIRPSKVNLTSRGKDVGEIELEKAYRARENQIWSSLIFDKCKEPKTLQDCAEVESFLTSFPTSERVTDAKQLLEEARPKFAIIQEETDWTASGVSACTKPASSDACDGVKGYLEKYPSGRHAEEAMALLKKVRDKLKTALAREEKPQKDAEAKAERERRAEEAQEARERRAEEARRRSCVAQCMQAVKPCYSNPFALCNPSKNECQLLCGSGD